VSNLLFQICGALGLELTELGMGTCMGARVGGWAAAVVLLMCSETAYGVLGSHQHVAMKF